MSIPCVVIASMPNPHADLTDFENAYTEMPLGDVDEHVDNEWLVTFRDPGVEDGGNGGGGEPGGTRMRPVRGLRKRGVWDFNKGKVQDPDWEKRYAEMMRFEFCSYFDDVSEASIFLAGPIGSKIKAHFKYVLIVAISIPK